MIRSHIGVTPHRGIVKMTHTERIAVVHVDACVPHGFTLIGLYLFCGVEYDDQNAGLLARVALLLASQRGPWFIAADWQMTPAELQKTNWPRAVGGVICCCPHATCTMSKRSRNVGHFMTSLDLAHRIVSVELSHGPLRPHSPVYLQLSGTSRPQIVRDLVCGLASCPRMASSGQRVLQPLLIGLLFGRAFMSRKRTVCWSRWLALAEAEALDLRHVHGQQVGRGQKLNRSVSSTWLSSQYAWRLARVWCEDLFCRQVR